MTEIIFVRHGETLWNQERRYQGQLDSPLTELGRRQAKLTAAHLAQGRIDAVYTSDLKRARMTAAAIGAQQGLTPQTDPRLREMSFGVWEGLKRAEVVEKYPEIFFARDADILSVRVPGGELPGEVLLRFRAFLGECVAQHQTGRVAVVSHGAGLRFALAGMLAMPLEKSYCLRLDNAGISRVVYNGQKGSCTWQMLCFNSTGHLT